MVCEDNYSVNFLKLTEYREKNAKIRFKHMGKKRGFHILKLNLEVSSLHLGLRAHCSCVK